MVSTVRIIFCIFLSAVPVTAQSLPAGTTINARFFNSTGSHVSHHGDGVEAAVIAPVTLHGNILVPQGSLIWGTVEQATAIGFGIRHRTALLSYRFHSLQLPTGEWLPLDVDLTKVETAKERVNSEGQIVGVHPGANLASASGAYTLPLLFINPVFGMPLWGVKALIAPATSPEIYLPPGAEVELRLHSALHLPTVPRPANSVAVFSETELQDFHGHLQASHTRAKSGKQLSDRVNLLLVGSRSEIASAFEAAGWVTAERHSPLALYRMYNALTKRVGYRTAPMTSLSLNGRSADFVYQKSLNNLASRHHVRFFRQSSENDLWFGTATEDVSISFRHMHWTHRIDPSIDRERAKIVNDLAYTGCLDAAGLLSRAPLADRSVITDGDIAVVRFNSCEKPMVMPGVAAQNASEPERWLPRVAFSFRDDMMRANPVFTAYNTVRSLASKTKAKPTVHLETESTESGLSWVKAMPQPTSGTQD